MWVWVAMAWAAEPAGGERALVRMCARELRAAADVAEPAETPASVRLRVAGAGFLNAVRVRVDARWKANLAAVSPSLRLSRPRYDTIVAITLDFQGHLTGLCVAVASGVPVLDRAVTQAFEEAAPFPAPPAELLREGTLHLRDLHFTVTLPGSASDPRAR
ncbi:MAG: TonB family protein [Myxococcota bacterium]